MNRELRCFWHRFFFCRVMVPDLHNVGEKHGGCIIYQALARDFLVLWLDEPSVQLTGEKALFSGEA